ncbi:hypothetical protein L484_011600 [Morus notabilis]|uniref:Uncharacterized protein n=1 Tax=Morus notabilis TaxID=981085 RepID=W9RAF6_9ROSA|nr:hypothetical protein L484_011600 [Morus notabilis]
MRSKSGFGKNFDNGSLPLKTAFELFDANFFDDKKMVEITKGVKELLVASVNGGLHYPSPLVFNPDWGNEQEIDKGRKIFSYP